MNKFNEGDLVWVPKSLSTSTSREKSEGRREGVYVRYCGDNCGMIRFEDGDEEMWNIGWMKPIKNKNKKVAYSKATSYL